MKYRVTRTIHRHNLLPGQVIEFTYQDERGLHFDIHTHNGGIILNQTMWNFEFEMFTTEKRLVKHES